MASFIAKETANVVLNAASLNQTYDGSPKTVTASTTPPGLALTITYNGSATPPTTAGIYDPVVATVNDPNYIGSAFGTLTVTPAPLTVTGITGIPKVYDRTTSATINTASTALNGVLPADAANVTLVTTGATGAFADKAVGNSKPVAVSGLALAGTAAGNYMLSQPALTANITAADLTVTGLTASSKVYDGTTAATLSGTPALAGVIGSDSVSASGTATGSFASNGVGAGKTVAVSGLALTGAEAGNYALNAPALSADITPAGLSVTGLSASNKVYDGTTAATITGSPTLVGVVGSDVVSISGPATGSFADANVGPAKPVTISGLGLSGSASGNYTLTQPTASANITALGLTVSGITAANKVYDGATTATLNTSGAALVGVLAPDTGNLSLVITGSIGTFADEAVGTGKLVTISGLALNGGAAGN